MELLTRNNFEGWMQKLMERLDRQDELLLAMKAEGKQPTITESIRLFDNQDLCMLLQISKRTLQRYRSVGALPYKTLGKKTYYSEEDVYNFDDKKEHRVCAAHKQCGERKNRLEYLCCIFWRTKRSVLSPSNQP